MSRESNPSPVPCDGTTPPSSLPARFKFTTFPEVKPIVFPRSITKEDDERENKRKPYGWYPQMTDDEEDGLPPKKKSKKGGPVSSSTHGPGSALESSQNENDSPSLANRGKDISSGPRANGARGAKWTEEEDEFALETWAEWPECTYNQLTELLNNKFKNDRTNGTLRHRLGNRKKWLMETLDAATDKNAPSMGWARDVAED